MPKKQEQLPPVHRPISPEIHDSVPQPRTKTPAEKLKQEDLDKLLSEDAEKFLNQNRQKGGE